MRRKTFFILLFSSINSFSKCKLLNIIQDMKNFCNLIFITIISLNVKSNRIIITQIPLTFEAFHQANSLVQIAITILLLTEGLLYFLLDKQTILSMRLQCTMLILHHKDLTFWWFLWYVCIVQVFSDRLGAIAESTNDWHLYIIDVQDAIT